MTWGFLIAAIIFFTFIFPKIIRKQEPNPDLSWCKDPKYEKTTVRKDGEAMIISGDVKLDEDSINKSISFFMKFESISTIDYRIIDSENNESVYAQYKNGSLEYFE